MGIMDAAKPGSGQQETTLEKRAEHLVIEIFKGLPGVRMVREATPQEDSGVQGIEKPLAIDTVVCGEERHAFVAQVTTASIAEKMQKMQRHTEDMPFVPTRRLADFAKYRQHDPAFVPRFNIRVERILMEHLEQDPENTRPVAEQIVLEQLRRNIRTRMESMVMDAKGKKLPKAQVERIKESDAYKQLEELDAMAAPPAVDERAGTTKEQDP